jgi:hypothetical protein
MDEVLTYRGLVGYFAEMGVVISSNQFWTWHKRRAVNGFPEPVAACIRPEGGGPRRCPMFLVEDVHKWWLGYDVKAQYRLGAAPQGNRYAVGRKNRS